MTDLSVLSNKTLVMLVGPSAVGKSTVMNEVIKLDQEFTRVKSFTTRQQRSNDEAGQYFYISSEGLKQFIDEDRVITQTVFPTTGQTYGTVQESYSGTFCMLDTLAHSVETYRELPFKETVAISITTDPDYWREWINHRYKNNSEEKVKRCNEAISSINWSLAQSQNHTWLINQPNDIITTAEKLIANVKTNQASESSIAIEYAEKVRTYATQIIEESK